MSLALLLAVIAAAPADLVDAAQKEPRWILDIKYATTDNFTGQKLYPVARCLLRAEVAEMLVRAQKWLDAHHPEHVLMLKDCYRPAHIQHVMWKVVEGTSMQPYVANPNSKTGSVHNYGAAVDLTLAKGGKEVDMGTPYDHLGILAEPRHEARFLAEGKLTQAQVDARHVLRDAMVQGGGFLALPNEWWHFDALQGKALRQKYEKLDVPLQAVP